MEQATLTDADLKCYHCGSPCRDTTCFVDDKAFCCVGCKTVYEILHAHRLDAYYELNDKAPGNQQLNSKSEEYYQLDSPEVIDQLLNFRDQEKSRVTFRIPNMHCSACIWLLEHLYRLHSGILSSKVDFPRKTVSILFDHNRISLRNVAELLDRLGYPPGIAHKPTGDEKESIAGDKSIYYKIGIAAFCFGNIMLLSFPEYVGLTGGVDEEYRQLFGALKILLSLPLVGYCASDYFSSAIKSMQQRYLNIDVPVALGITVLFLRSVYDILIAGSAGYLDSLAGLVFFLLIGKWFQQKTYANLSFDRDYRAFFPLAVKVKSDGGVKVKALDKVSTGDVLIIRNNELIPADSRLLSDTALVDYSFVTGESRPVNRKRGDILYGGGKHLGQSVEVEVVKPVSQSYLLKLWNENNSGKAHQKNGIARLIDRVSHYFTLVILAIATLSALFWLVYGHYTDALFVFTAVLIVACPCALALTSPFAYGNALRILARNKIFLKNAQVVETIAGINALLLDKTGTLSSNTHTQISYSGDALSDIHRVMVRSAVAHSIHPLSQAVYEHLHQVPVTSPLNYKEIPGEGLSATFKEGKVLIGSEAFLRKSGIKVAPGQNHTQGATVHIAIDGQNYGVFVLHHRYREPLLNALKELRKRYHIGIISGDHDGERMLLQKILGDGVEMYFEQSPFDKVELVERKKNKYRVMMIGDGINDAGALKTSDVGVAVTENLNYFTPASDCIYDAASFDRFCEFLAYCRSCRTVVKGGLVFSFTYNAIGISVAVAGLLTPVFAAILMPLSSISVVVYATIATTLIARKKRLI